MAAMPSLKLLFDTAYRGTIKDWSIKCHFSGGLPADGTHWDAFVSDMFDDVLAMIPDRCRLKGAVGYQTDALPAVYTHDFGPDVGTLIESGGQKQAAYVAALASWTTDARNARGAPIFLRNFIHGAASDDTDLDQVLAAQDTAITAWAHKFSDAGTGYSDGTNTYKRAGPNGAVGLEGSCRDFLSHRVLARRG